MSETANLPRFRRRSTGLYVLTWLLLGGAATAYLGAVSLKPDLVGGLIASRRAAPEDNATARAAAEPNPAQAEVSRLRTALGQRDAEMKALQLRVAGLQKDLEATRSTGDANAATAVTTKTPSVAPVAAAESPTAAGPAAATSAETAAKPAGKPLEVQIVNATPVPLSMQGVATGAAVPSEALVANVPPPVRRPELRDTVGPVSGARIETGSLSAPATAPAAKAPPVSAPVAFGPAVVTRKAAEPAVGVRLSSGPSVDALRLSWSLMSERYGSELGGLEPRYIAGGNSAAPYALIAGPVGDKTQAKALCQSLQQKGIPCSVDDYKGNAL